MCTSALSRALLFLLIVVGVACGEADNNEPHSHDDGTHEHGPGTHEHDDAGLHSSTASQPTETTVDTSGKYFGEEDSVHTDAHHDSHSDHDHSH